MKNELEKCEILPAPHSASENLASHSYAISNSFESVSFFKTLSMGKICVFSWLLSLSYDNCVSPHSHIGGKFGKLSIPHTFECQDIFLHETRLKMHFRSKTAMKITFPRHYLKIHSFQKCENRTFSALSNMYNKVLSNESSLSITSQHSFKRQ